MAKYFIITLSLAAVLFAACSKKATIPVDTQKDWLRNSKWKIASGTLTVKKPNGKDTVLNYLDWIPACNKDDYFGFNTATTGSFFNGGVRCAPSDPDSISFTYELSNDNKYLSLYCSDHLYYSVNETILPWVIDTLVFPPSDVVLDTLHGVNDTAAGYTRTLIVMDTLWKLHFAPAAVDNINIVNAPITNFTANSFTLYFTLKAQYPDSTNLHPGAPDWDPIIRVDTFKYKINFTAN